MAKSTLKIMQYQRSKIFRVLLAIFQHYAWNGELDLLPMSTSFWYLIASHWAVIHTVLQSAQQQ